MFLNFIKVYGIINIFVNDINCSKSRYINDYINIGDGNCINIDDKIFKIKLRNNSPTQKKITLKNNDIYTILPSQIKYKTNHETLKNNYESSKNNYESSKNYYETSKNNHEVLKNNHESLKNNHESLKNNHESSKNYYESFPKVFKKHRKLDENVLLKKGKEYLHNKQHTNDFSLYLLELKIKLEKMEIIVEKMKYFLDYEINEQNHNLHFHENNSVNSEKHKEAKEKNFKNFNNDYDKNNVFDDARRNRKRLELVNNMKNNEYSLLKKDLPLNKLKYIQRYHSE
ncbi:hypothetical protein DMUE_1932 [Dictyocoela muelleri]|nr:hypothetical protein DMUE_1932 [Dictyocoela muelleri]